MNERFFPAVPARVIVLLGIGMVALVALLVLVSSAAFPAVFDDSNDRKPIRALRNKPAGQLADQEKAILVAANRIGTFSLCSGEIGGSAFLIRYEGRSAIVTNAHLFMTGDGSPTACAGRMEDGASYMPRPARGETAIPARQLGQPARNVPVHRTGGDIRT